MATTAELQVRDRVFIGGEWVEPDGVGGDRGGQLDHRGGDGEDPGLHAGGRRPRRGRRPRGLRVVVADASREERAAYLAAIAARLGERAEEIAATIAQELGMPLKLSQDHPGRPADRPVRGDAEADRGGRLGGGDRQLAGAARAGRRARRDHPLELPAQPDRRQGRAGAGRRLHGGAEAERGGAAERLHPRRGDRGRRPPGRASSTSSPGPGPSSARRSPATPASTWSPSPARPGPGGASPSWPRRR